MAEQKKTNQWASRKLQAFVLRSLITLVPMAAAIAISATASRVVGEPTRPAMQGLWLAMVVIVSTLVLVITSFAMRRFLPLVTLLRLSLVFPDQAPSRFRSAMRVGSVRMLEQRLDEARQGGRPGETLDETAVRVVELATALRLHDRRTRGHCERVRVYADMIGKELGLPRSDREKLHWAALLHDIGKLEVPGLILNKNGKPTAEEWEVLKGHPDAGRKLIEPLIEWLGPWAAAAWEHHEFWDGRGYPRGISGSEITLSGRIVAVADAYEVMTATRSYKKPLTPSAARQELTRCAGGQFDPTVVRALLSLSIGRLGWAMGPITWIAQLPFLGWTAPAALPATLSTVGRTIVLASAIHAVAPSVVSLTPAEAAATAPAPAATVVSHPEKTSAATDRTVDSLTAPIPTSTTGTPPSTPRGPQMAPADSGSVRGRASSAPGSAGSLPSQAAPSPRASGSAPGRAPSAPAGSGPATGGTGSAPAPSVSTSGRSGSTPVGSSSVPQSGSVTTPVAVSGQAAPAAQRVQTSASAAPTQQDSAPVTSPPVQGQSKAG